MRSGILQQQVHMPPQLSSLSELYSERRVQQPGSRRESYMLAQLLGVCAVIIVVAYCSSQHIDSPVAL